MGEILGQICGIIIMIGVVVTNQLPKRWHMLLGYSFINLFSSLNQLFVGAGLTSCFLCAIATVHCAINAIKVKKERPIRIWENILWSIIYLIVWGVGFVFSFSNGTPFYLDAMTLAATVFFIGSTLLPRERDMRLCTFANSLIYFAYDLINLNVAFLAKLFAMISVVVALYRYRDKNKRK